MGKIVVPSEILNKPSKLTPEERAIMEQHAPAVSGLLRRVADVFDALTTDRPYHRGFTIDEASIMVAKDVGKMFDRDLFARFERVVRGMKGYHYPSLRQRWPVNRSANVGRSPRAIAS